MRTLNLRSYKTVTILLAFVLFGLLSSCSFRERANPLDPKNSVTAGRPTRLKISASADTVILSWQPILNQDLTGYRVYRSAPPDQVAIPFVDLAVTNSKVEDATVVFGNEYRYKVTALVDDYESPPSTEIIVEPGPTKSIVANNGLGELQQRSHDSRHFLKVLRGFDFIYKMEGSPLYNKLWLIDVYLSNSGNVFAVNMDSFFVKTEIPLPGPRDISINKASGNVWIADVESRVVWKFDNDGHELLKIDGFANPSSVSVDQATGDCWVADKAGKKVFRLLSGNGSKISETDSSITAPVDLLSDPLTGGVWVADQTKIIKLNKDAKFIAGIEWFSELKKLALDEREGAVWALGLEKVSKIDSLGNELFSFSDLSSPSDLIVNHYDGSCLVTDVLNHRVIRISHDGLNIQFVDGFSFPEAVAVWPR